MKKAPAYKAKQQYLSTFAAKSQRQRVIPQRRRDHREISFGRKEATWFSAKTEKTLCLGGLCPPRRLGGEN
jgi:hypothetical protein